MLVECRMTDLGSSSVTIDELPEVARNAWLRLRDELNAVLGEDLVAIWAYGGTVVSAGAPRAADLDTYVIVNRSPDEATAQRIEAAHEQIGCELGVQWDAWYVLADDARRPEPPRHAYREGRRDTSWAINRAHWLAGRYVRLHGPVPAEIVPPPRWEEIEVDLRRELEHLERHVVEGDTDPYEASYAILNGSRILHALETGNVAISKREAGSWALAHLPTRWHVTLRAAQRCYQGQRAGDDGNLIAAEMAPFVAFVRERLPRDEDRPADALPRWSGY